MEGLVAGMVVGWGVQIGEGGIRLGNERTVNALILPASTLPHLIF